MLCLTDAAMSKQTIDCQHGHIPLQPAVVLVLGLTHDGPDHLPRQCGRVGAEGADAKGWPLVKKEAVGEYGVRLGETNIIV